MLSAAALGRFHPLLVHLPVGILLFAAGLMLFEKVRKTDVNAAVSFAWALGAVSALLACATGWLLAQSGEYDADLVQKHQWTGLLTAALGTMTYFANRLRWAAATATVFTLTIAGHYGGNLTHGEGYLFDSEQIASEFEEIPASTKPVVLKTDSIIPKNQKLVRRTFPYRDQVVPVLKSKCYNCHSAAKKKGSLRLDSEHFIQKGGKNGKVLVAGAPHQSKLYTYLLLPESDDRHMPPKGKLQMSKNELNVLFRWIQSGASFKEEVIEETLNVAITATEQSRPVFLETKTNTEAPLSKPDLETNLLTKTVAEADPELLRKLKEQQISLNPIAPESGYLSANFVNAKSFDPETLAGVREQLMRLRLTGLPVQDADVKSITQFRNLTRLNLERTGITDEALITLAELPNLEQLNLYGTAITDKGLESLENYPNLKFVYLWQTKTTAKGIATLRKSRPDLTIDTGGLQLTKPDINKAL